MQWSFTVSQPTVRLVRRLRFPKLRLPNIRPWLSWLGLVLRLWFGQEAIVFRRRGAAAGV